MSDDNVEPAPGHTGVPLAAEAASGSAAAQGWLAQLELGFECRGERTILAAQKHVGPLLVQRPFYPEADGTCHVYVLHPPGGVVGGDRLRIAIRAEGGSRVLLTTPAAGKFYRGTDLAAEQSQVIRVASGACVEWLPQETIVFDGALAALRTEVHLERDAQFIGWDILCLGRPAAAETFTQGRFHADMEIWRDGRPLLIERGRIAGSGDLLTAPWGLAGYPVSATLVAVGEAPGMVEAARAAAGPDEPDGLLGITGIEGILVARYLGRHTEAARLRLTRVWDLARQALLGKPAEAPPIWRS
jgi:urease accessory protein